MPDETRVRALGNDRFAIEIRGHQLFVDQPIRDGGDDTAPTPTELFVAGLASCVAFYARRFLARNAIDAHGLEVSAQYTMAARPARVGGVTIHITPPPGLPEERRAAFLAVASHCTVHNTLENPPAVTVALDVDDNHLVPVAS